MHAYAPQRVLRGRCGHLLRGLCRVAGIDPRRCLCVRCIAVRSGLFLRTRTWVGHLRARPLVHVLGAHP